MKYALLIFLAIIGNEAFTQEVVYQQSPVVVIYQYPVVVYQPVVEQNVRWIPIVENRVAYVPVRTVPVQPQEYWIHDRGLLLCKERWRYVPYNY